MSEMENFTYIADFDTQLAIEQARDGGRHVMNDTNMSKFKQVCGFFAGLAEENDGEVAYIDISPESVNALVSVKVPNVDMHGDSMKQFSETLWLVDTFEIERVASDSLLINAGVNCVWEVAASE